MYGTAFSMDRVMLSSIKTLNLFLARTVPGQLGNTAFSMDRVMLIWLTNYAQQGQSLDTQLYNTAFSMENSTFLMKW